MIIAFTMIFTLTTHCLVGYLWYHRGKLDGITISDEIIKREVMKEIQKAIMNGRLDEELRKAGYVRITAKDS